jgi:hypothetical protein
VLFSGWSSDKWQVGWTSRMPCCLGGSKTYPRLLEWAPLARIRLFCDGMLFEGRVQKSFWKLPHHRRSKESPSTFSRLQSFQMRPECERGSSWVVSVW